ncbi:MAG: glycoside hydrolase family 3 protein [Clostridia bacterium]|nr:glycoside hydrolase family 3 protein [Clostridia bacterium]
MIKDKFMNLAGKVYVKFSGVAQEKTLRAKEKITVTDEMKDTLRRVAGEGAVLIKNNGVLPLKKGTKVSLFGRVQHNWFFTGYGSGGDVNRPYAVNLIDGIRKCPDLVLNEQLAITYESWCIDNIINDAVWGMWPRFYPEMPITDGDVLNASIDSECAVVTIGRSSGEDRENALEKGSYYLTDDERKLLDKVAYRFDKTVVLLNIGSLIDLAWIEEYGDKIDAVLILWQGGMESGNAAADLLCGKTNPCGKLTSTVSRNYTDQPSAKDFGGKKFNNYTEDIYVGYRYFETFNKDAVLYPFGYGLSYTDFEIGCSSAVSTKDGFRFDIEIKNTGSLRGKEAFGLYVKKPIGVLGNPEKQLVAFGKSKLISPQKSQSLKADVSFYQLASYDDSGITGFKSAYVIEKGEYEFYLGGDVRNAQKIFTYYQEETVLYSQLSQCLAPENSFPVLNPIDGTRLCTANETNLKTKILDNMPKATPITGDKGYKLQDVKSRKVSMDDFVAQLSLTELEAITRGDYTMGSLLGTPGNASVYCGVLESLRSKGIPAVSTSDGPSGIRLRASCSLIPIGTLLASTFDIKAVKDVYSLVALEMKEKGSDVLLAPGMNIHRNPLCGRNFEYYSEDPYLTGKIGAAAVMGIQAQGGSACPKHFACNNQEIKRLVNDSRVSERALREIYLKGFEICIKEAKPKNIMTSYNKVNGVWSYYNYDLVTSVLRDEWGYEGCVMTDWWTKSDKSPLFPKVFDNAYRVRAQVDVLMPGGGRAGNRKPDDSLLKYVDNGGITLGEIQRSAKNILNFAMNSTAYKE